MCNVLPSGNVTAATPEKQIMQELPKQKDTKTRNGRSETVQKEKNLAPRPPAINDLKFVVKASIALAGRVIQDIDWFLQELNSRRKK